ADDRGGVVGAASAQGGGNAILSGRDESAQHRHRTAAEQRKQMSASVLGGGPEHRSGAGMPVVSNDALAAVHEASRNGAGSERGGNQIRVNQINEGQQAIAHLGG